MTGRYGTGGCFYSLFSSQKSSRAQIRAGISLRSRGRTWGNLPIEAGRSPRGRLRYPRKGEQGTRGLKDRWGWDGGRPGAGERSTGSGRSKNRYGGLRSAHCPYCPKLSRKKEDSVQAAGRGHGLPVTPAVGSQGWRRRQRQLSGLGPLMAYRMALAGRGAEESPRRAGASGQKTVAGIRRLSSRDARSGGTFLIPAVSFVRSPFPSVSADRPGSRP